jgi:Flp pilus assembly protein TadD
MVSSKSKQTTRSANFAKSSSSTRPTQPPKPKPKPANYSLDDLLEKIQQLTEEAEYELAIKFAKKAVEMDAEGDATWEVLGSLYAEVGESDKAREVDTGRALWP